MLRWVPEARAGLAHTPSRPHCPSRRGCTSGRDPGMIPMASLWAYAPYYFLTEVDTDGGAVSTHG